MVDWAEKAYLLLFADETTGEILTPQVVAHAIDRFGDYSHKQGLLKASFTDRFCVFQYNDRKVTTKQGQTNFVGAKKDIRVSLLVPIRPMPPLEKGFPQNQQKVT